MTKCNALNNSSAELSPTKSQAVPLSPSRSGGHKLQIHAKKDSASPMTRRKYPRRGSKTAAMLILDCCGRDGERSSRNNEMNLQGSFVPTNDGHHIMGSVTEQHHARADGVLTTMSPSPRSQWSPKELLISPTTITQYRAASLPFLPESSDACSILMPVAPSSLSSSDITTAVQLPAFLHRFSTSTDISSGSAASPVAKVMAKPAVEARLSSLDGDDLCVD